MPSPIGRIKAYMSSGNGIPQFHLMITEFARSVTRLCIPSMSGIIRGKEYPLLISQKHVELIFIKLDEIRIVSGRLGAMKYKEKTAKPFERFISNGIHR
jgi:hypothetical protein